jgi:hypothetical protein
MIWRGISVAAGALAALAGCGSDNCHHVRASDRVALSNLACAPANVVSGAISSPCLFSGDAGGIHFREGFSVASETPGVCHVELKFKTGFTYSAAVTFEQRSDPGCGEVVYHYVVPTQETYVVNNPRNTCVDAGP